MQNPNDSLPDNLKKLISHLSTSQAIPLGVMSGIPFLAVKLPEEKAQLLQETVTCEFRPSVLNIDLNDITIALCFVQFRLNETEAYTYTTVYDLKNDQQYDDCHKLLNMRQHGLLIATDTVHDFISFETYFETDFDPRTVIAAAENRGTDYKPEEFAGIVHAFTSQTQSATELWNLLEKSAPLEQQWYGRMKMELEATDD